MSSLTLDPTAKRHGIDWAARLIPGAGPASQGQVKAKSTRTKLRSAVAPIFPPFHNVNHRKKEHSRIPVSERAIHDLIRSTLKDYALVLLDWILIGRIVFQFRPSFLSAPGSQDLKSSISLTVMGMALLQGILINLLRLPATSRMHGNELRAEVWSVARAIFWSNLVLSSALQLQGFSGWALGRVWMAGLLHFCTMCGWRWGENDGKKRGLHVTRGVRNVLIVGAGRFGHRIADYVQKHPEMDRSVCGFLDDRLPLGNDVIGRTTDLIQVARTGFVDEVILAPPHDQTVTLRLLHTARQLRLDVKMAPHLFGCEPVGNSEILGSIPLISLNQENLPVGGLMLKRALDIAFSGFALAFMAPLLLFIVVLIRADSRGSALYKAPRAGRKGKPFRCYKFRTMRQDADDLKEGLRNQNQRSGPFFKITHDPRITKVGAFLRRYSLDELPQLWNVLRGEMSMVGPRPHPLDDVSAYGIEHLSRLDVAPGITGLWQVTARQNPSFQTGMALDIDYIQHWSLMADLRILFKTVGAVLNGSGQ